MLKGGSSNSLTRLNPGEKFYLKVIRGNTILIGDKLHNFKFYQPRRESGEDYINIDIFTEKLSSISLETKLESKAGGVLTFNVDIW